MSTFIANKKANIIASIILPLAFLLTFAIITILSYVIYDAMTVEMNNAGILSTPDAQTAKAGFDRGMNMWDKIMLMLVAVIIGGMVVSSFKVATSPIFWIVTFIMVPFIGMASLAFNVIGSQFAQQTAVASVLNHFPLTLIIITNFHWIALVLLIAGAITLYAKKEKAQGFGP